MRTNPLMWLAVAGIGLLAGCVISIADSCGRPKEPFPPPPGVTVHKDTTVAEIEAVCRLGRDADRHDLLMQIAGRPNLSPPAQAYLVKMVRERLGNDHARMDVLMVLAENPCLHDEGVRAILAAIDSLGSNANRRAVLEAIGRSRARPPMPGPIPVPGGPGFVPGPGPGPIPVPEVPPPPQPGPH